MPTFYVQVQDTVTLRRSTTILIAAPDERTAKELAVMRASREDGIDWRQEEIDNTPYEAEVVEPD